MKPPLNLHVLLALCLTAVAPLATTAQITTFFSDDFTAGSTSTVNQPNFTPTVHSTSYQTDINNTPSTNTIGATSFTVAFPAQTSIVGEFLGRFTNAPVPIVAPGDFLTVTVIFTNTFGIYTNSSGNSTLAIGLYNSGGVAPNQGPIMLNVGPTTGGSQGWLGYVGRIIATGGNGSFFTRPAQTAVPASSQNQDLIFNNASSSAGYNNPTGQAPNNVGGNVSSPPQTSFPAGPTAVYTLQLSAAYNGAASLLLTNNIYVGAGTGGTLLYSKTGIATNASFLTASFDSFAVGWRNASTAAQLTTMDVNSITVVGHSTLVTGPPHIDTQPTEADIPTGAAGAFIVSATGFGTTYQWHRNATNLLDGGNISGANSPILVINPAGSADVPVSTDPSNGYYVTVSGVGPFSTNSVTNTLTLSTATNLTWKGTLTTWDLNNTLAWVDPFANDSVFNFGDPVTFDDSGTGGNVNLASPFLSAGSVTVNSPTFAYNFLASSSGSFAGPGQLIYEGAGQLTIGNNNTYTGGTILTNSATKLVLQNLGGLGTGLITLAAPGVQMEITVAGATGNGIPNNVNVADDCSIQFDALGTFAGVFNGDWSGTANKILTLNPDPGNTTTNQRVRLLGSSTVYNAKLVLNSPMISLANYVGNNGTQIFNGVISGPGFLIQRGGGTTILNALNTYSGGTVPTTGNIGFGIDSVGSVTSGPIGTGPLLLAPEVPNTTGSGTVLAFGGARTIANPIQYNSATNNLTLIVGGTNDLTFTGPYTLNGNDLTNGVNNLIRTLQVDNTGLTTISGVISDATNGVSAGFGLTKTGTNTLVLSNTETYTGPTTVSAGTLQLNGQLNAASAVTVTNATLSGTGTNNGPVTITANGTLAPGAASIGTLTFANNLSFAGSVKVRVNHSGSAADQARVIGTLISSGTTLLTVTNIGAALQVNDTFAVFNKGVTGGGAIGVTGGGVTWSNNLAAAGTIIVIATTPPRPLITSTVLKGTNVVFSGTNGVVTTPYYVLASTNVVKPLVTWTPILTNTFGPGGGFLVTNPIVPGTPYRFYMLRLP